MDAPDSLWQRYGLIGLAVAAGMALAASFFYFERFSPRASAAAALTGIAALLAARWRGRVAEAALRDAHERLQAEMAERTGQLYETVQSLRLEIQERERAEQARSELETERQALVEQLQRQLESMPVAYLLTDAGTRYTYWNPAAERIFGFSRAEVIGKHPFEVIVPPQSQAQVGGVFARLRAGENGLHGVSENRTRDERTIICEWHTTALREPDGTFAGVQSMALDITERQQLEAQLLQSQKMEAVGRLAGGVAHDFNNLLTAISGYNLLLMEGLKDPDLLPLAREVQSAAERGAALTGQLLSFSRKRAPQPRALDLNDVVKRMGNLLRRIIGEDIELKMRLREPLRAVNADPSQLDQLIVNLVVNARDAMPDGGTLEIETGKADLGPEPGLRRIGAAQGNYVTLRVSDTGSGMDEAVLEHLFEPFFSGRPHSKGTGLGLSIVHGILKQNGGDVEVSSEAGRGSSFLLYLPAVEAEAEIAKPAAAASRDRGTETILLVEDEAPVRRLVRDMLRHRGYQVLEAATGEEALAAAAAHEGTLDLLLTDVVMPQMNGVDLAKRLRASRESLAVVFMSGYPDVKMAADWMDERMAYLQKPFTSESLVATLRRLLPKKRD